MGVSLYCVLCVFKVYTTLIKLPLANFIANATSVISLVEFGCKCGFGQILSVRESIGIAWNGMISLLFPHISYVHIYLLINLYVHMYVNGADVCVQLCVYLFMSQSCTLLNDKYWLKIALVCLVNHRHIHTDAQCFTNS